MQQYVRIQADTNPQSHHEVWEGRFLRILQKATHAPRMVHSVMRLMGW